jgi:DNA-binding transcriptional ArsR family regulator
MRILREAGLVSGRRDGRRVEYRIERQGFEALCSELGTLARSARAGAPNPPRSSRRARPKRVRPCKGGREVNRR